MTIVKRREAEKLRASLQAAHDLAAAGLPMPKQPRTEVPDLAGVDLTDLEDGLLMDLMTKLARWADFSGAQLAIADVDEAFAKAYVDQLKARHLVETYDAGDEEEQRGPRGGKLRSGPGLTVARAGRTLDEVYQSAVQEQLNAYARRKLLAARHEAFERDAAVVSRELSRRLERDPVQRRVARGGAK